jgi:hypothetical protein
MGGTPRKTKLRRPDAISGGSPALALTTFRPFKVHTVKSRYRFAVRQLKLTPFVGRSFDKNKTILGLRLNVVTTFRSFTYVPVVVAIDRKTVRIDQNWRTGTSFSGQNEETDLQAEEVVRELADAKEAYMTVLFQGEQAPFDRTFKVSPDQAEDCVL